MKKCQIFLIVLLIIFLSVFSCKKEETTKKVMVGMATDVGGLGDKSFNDGCHEGLKKGQSELGIDIRVVESKQMTDYVPNLSGLAEDGCKLVFAVGFLMADAITEAAKNNPENYYAGIDIFMSPDQTPENVLGLLFKEQESGYLAGIVAGLLTKKYASVSPKLNDENVLGMVLGMDIPPVERYQAGFYAGVKAVNPDCKVLSVVSGSFNDQAKGKEATIALIEQGADIVFQIAGLTGLGVFNACKEKNVLALGVDVDQNYVAPETILTSAVKGITQASYLTIQSVINGTFEGGKNITFGIKEGATGLSPFYSFDSMIPAEVKEKLKEVEDEIKAGTLMVPASRAEAGYQG